ncbi:Putative Holin-X, holin superfamily III [Paraburkholderia fungorum]|uniref:Putative Holin-X, holin superfamily III n=1 Tax=Paraburkholderia fungorum TaxID=134537 RepID=A0A1H1JPB9_9BURK|nr:phage holin family protein [Paraburkholderia fungorum]SDR51856.1 Putative Holin-X, holin superfamily III [Paraburkholderia fungorum]
MSLHSNLSRWRNVGQFCIERIADYSELVALEVDDTKRRLVREVVAVIVMAVAALFALSFLCIALIATAWGTPYFLTVVWGVAILWMVVTLASLIVARAQKLSEPLHIVQSEIRSDLDALRESLK